MRSNMTEYRSFNRGFGHGNYKPYRKPHRPSPLHKGDLFVEAGKLAVEYLVSHGFLSSDVLSIECQNRTQRNNPRDKEVPRSPIKEHSDAVDVGPEEIQDGAGEVDLEKEMCMDDLDIKKREGDLNLDSSNNNAAENPRGPTPIVDDSPEIPSSVEILTSECATAPRCGPASNDADQEKPYESLPSTDKTLSDKRSDIFDGNNRENIPSVDEEKELFSSSFRVCDLNLMGSSDINDNRDVPSIVYSPVSASATTTDTDRPVGIDLTTTNNSSLNDDNMPTSAEVGVTNTGNFPNNPQNPTDNPDNQNGYSLMISELLDNNDPNCSSVQPEMSCLHNDIGLNHQEGMFPEDDSIYMALGEIPMNLLPVWEQNNQERNPFGL